jgi:hypothetical protein
MKPALLFFSLALAIALLVPTPMSAHEGHAHKVMGTVTAVHDTHLEVKDKDGKISTHALDPKTKIRRGKSIASTNDIKVGDRVVVTSFETKDKAGKSVVTVTQVDLGVTPVAAK